MSVTTVRAPCSAGERTVTVTPGMDEPLGVDHGTPDGAGLAALRQRGGVQRNEP